LWKPTITKKISGSSLWSVFLVSKLLLLLRMWDAMMHRLWIFHGGSISSSVLPFFYASRLFFFSLHFFFKAVDLVGLDSMQHLSWSIS